MLDDLGAQLEALTAQYQNGGSNHHDAGNALAAARALIEAMSDGVLEETADRLSAVQASLQRARSLLRARPA